VTCGVPSIPVHTQTCRVLGLAGDTVHLLTLSAAYCRTNMPWLFTLKRLVDQARTLNAEQADQGGDHRRANGRPRRGSSEIDDDLTPAPSTPAESAHNDQSEMVSRARSAVTTPRTPPGAPGAMTRQSPSVAAC
jgi:hypothetical protein